MPFGNLAAYSGFNFPAGLERLGGRENRPAPVRQAAASFQGSSDTNLSVVTAEGDHITISLQAHAELSAASYRGPDGSADASVRSVSSELNVSVEGDLSREELGDLKRLFRILTRAQKQAESGGQVDLDKLARRLSKLDSVASFDYSHQQTIQAGVLFEAAG